MRPVSSAGTRVGWGCPFCRAWGSEVSDAPITLELTVSELDGDTVVRAAGELDVNTAPELREQLARLIAEDARQIVIDLTEVSFVDSTALSVLVSALKG
ncbi:MAG: STAS domain-containing protein [Actinobacteria bacterium]|nr:MAG: STAS domain-containing protein [Actinomycetota bacterium]